LKIRLTLGDWAIQKAAAEAIRYEVFVIEQNVPVELEWDEMDVVSLHAIASDVSDEVVGTGRLLPDGHIGRMAVRKSARGVGVGSEILQALMAEAKRRGDLTVVLHAQIQAVPFYARFGFVREGDEFMEAGIPHICMRCCFDV